MMRGQISVLHHLFNEMSMCPLLSACAQQGVPWFHPSLVPTLHSMAYTCPLHGLGYTAMHAKIAFTMHYD